MTELEAASDHSLLVTFGEAIDASLHRRVRSLFVALERERITGVINLHPGYSSLLVDFDPMRVSAADVERWIRHRLAGEGEREPDDSCLQEVPVCYGGEFGPDLEAVASHCGMTAEEVVQRHSGPEYVVYFLGFSPGFPYLGGMDRALETPRLESPRKHVSAGSVAIGGRQTGIYPLASPGGWRIIGRTPLRLFDPRREPPTLLRMGDRLRFRPVTRAEFDRLEQRG